MFKKVLLLSPFIIGGKLYFMGGKGLFKTQLHQSQQDKTIIVTGGSDGLGFENVQMLAASQAQNIIIASRNERKAKEKIQEFKSQYGDVMKSNLHYIHLDLNDLQSIDKFIQEFERKYSSLDTLINNAGVMPYELKTTKQGYEYAFGVNHLGPFLLTLRLLPFFKKNSEECKIINVSSRAHLRVPKDFSFEQADFYFEKLNKDQFPIKNYQIYPVSKLANILFTNKLQQYLAEKNSQIKVFSLHPGIALTNIVQDLTSSYKYGYYLEKLLKVIGWYFFKNPYQAAMTTNYLAQSFNKELVGGGYYRDCLLYKTSKEGQDQKSADALWKKSIELLEKNGQKLSI